MFKYSANKIELGTDMCFRINFLARRMLRSSVGGHEHSTSMHDDGTERMAPIMIRKQEFSAELSFFYDKGMQMNRGNSRNRF